MFGRYSSSSNDWDVDTVDSTSVDAHRGTLSSGSGWDLVSESDEDWNDNSNTREQHIHPHTTAHTVTGDRYDDPLFPSVTRASAGSLTGTVASTNLTLSDSDILIPVSGSPRRRSKRKRKKRSKQKHRGPALDVHGDSVSSSTAPGTNTRFLSAYVRRSQNADATLYDREQSLIDAMIGRIRRLATRHDDGGGEQESQEHVLSQWSNMSPVATPSASDLDDSENEHELSLMGSTGAMHVSASKHKRHRRRHKGDELRRGCCYKCLRCCTLTCCCPCLSVGLVYRRCRKALSSTRALKIALGILAVVLGLVLVSFVVRIQARAHFRDMLQVMHRSQFVQCSSSPSIREQCHTAHPHFNTSIYGDARMYLMRVSPADSKRVDIHPVEALFLGTVYVRLAKRNMMVMEDILCGAHVVVHYNRNLQPALQRFYYRLFSHMYAAYARGSSHSSASVQYGIPEGSVLRTLLVGEQQRAAVMDTWFQLEAAEWNPWRHPFDSLMHAMFYFEYELFDVQIGPLGTSPHTDQRPLELAFHE
jgi:hypothetical protein